MQIGETLVQSLRMKESEFKELKCCGNCGEFVEKDIVIVGKKLRVKVLCSCKKDEKIAKEKKQADAEKQIRLNQIFTNSLMDKQFFDSNFVNWDRCKGNDKIYNISIRYSKNFKQMKKENVGLLFYGAPGNGKTFASCCIANYLLKQFIPVICVGVNSLLQRIQNTYNSYGKEGELNIIRALANADLLIIDDLGVEQKTEWSVTRIYNIIDSRYRNGLPTIITTNLSLTEIEDKYSKRTYDRLIEMCTPVLNEGISIRKDKGREKTNILKSLLEG